MKGFYVTGGNGSVLILEDGRYVDTFVEETSEKNGATEDILLRLLTEMTDTLAEPPRSAPSLYGNLNQTGFEVYIGAGHRHS